MPVCVFWGGEMDKKVRRATQAHIERAIRAARRAGMNSPVVRIDADGTITISESILTPETTDEFEKWQAGRKH